MGNAVDKIACPKCQEQGNDTEGDNLVVYDNGTGYCFACSHYEPSIDGMDAPEEESESLQKAAPAMSTTVDASAEMARIGALSSLGLKSRGLSADHMELYGIKVEVSESNGQPVAVYFPRHRNGTLVAYKKRPLAEKKFISVGDGKDCDLFGEQLAGGRKLCIVTEGEFDAVAMKQALTMADRDYRVVSLSNGATLNLSESSHAWLGRFEKIIAAFDMDDAGETAALKLDEMFPGVVARAHLPKKDANECLSAGMHQELVSAVMNAREYEAEGLVLAGDMRELVMDQYRNQAQGIPYPAMFDNLNEMTPGLLTGRLDVYGAGTAVGKSSFMRELTYAVTQVSGEKLGILSLEETAMETVLGQMSIHAEKPFHNPKVRPTVTDEELDRAFSAVTEQNNLIVMDHGGKMAVDKLFNKVAFAASAWGVKYFVLDHLHQIALGMNSEEEERHLIAGIMGELKALTQRFDIWIGLVSHVRKSSGRGFERGEVPGLDDFLGSSAIKQLADSVVAFSRDSQAPDPIVRNTSLATVLKNRIGAVTGPADLYHYDLDTGRLQPSGMDYDDYVDSVGDSRKAPSMR